MTLTGALIQSGGFGYLGNYNAGAPLYPVANQGMAVAWNYNSGSRDMALFNTDTAATMVTRSVSFWTIWRNSPSIR